MSEEKEKYNPKAKRKVRAEKYEPPVKFEGTLEEMIKMAGNPIRGNKSNGGAGSSGGG